MCSLNNMTKCFFHEAGVLSLDAAGSKFRVRLINEGEGSSAIYPREFFTEANAQALAGSLSFAGHPDDLDQPEQRNPLAAIGYIGEAVTIETDESGQVAFWGEYNVAKSKPEVMAYLTEFSDRLGLSIYAEGQGRRDPETGKYIAESLNPDNPYRSVDLVVAAGRGGKFDRMVESLRRITEASALAEGKEVDLMELKELGEQVSKLTVLVESLVTTLTTKAVAEAQVEADSAAVITAVESRLADYDKAVVLISEGKLTDSQSAELRARALKGEDVAPLVESAKKILAEAVAFVNKDENDSAAHIGGGAVANIGFDVAGFGKVS